MINLLWTRPYVFAFLVAFLFLSTRRRGLFFTLLWLVLGYFIAWASEASSIRTGFPYGWYFYLYENLEPEWLNAGVPIWDSVSYVFLSFAGLSVAEKILSSKKIIFLSLAGAFFTMLLDAVIDPLAHLGDQWFLGKIYYYPEPGFYFDVPLSNFAGWFLVSFLIIFTNLWIESRVHPVQENSSSLGIIFYFLIFLFNWTITLSIHQWGLALCDLIWISIPTYFLIHKSQKSP